MTKFDVVIVGSGLGGLECAYILTKKGLNVCILEKNSQIGGCLQSFKRGDYEFDTGFHYVGGLQDGQPLNRLFQYFDLMKLPWHQLDENGFDEVIFKEKSYLFSNGFECFADAFSSLFPNQQQNLKKYSEFLKNVGQHIFDSFKKTNVEELNVNSLFAQSAYHFLTDTITDPVLQNILSGTALKMELKPESLPLYNFAQINSSYIQSAWRLKGESSQIANALSNSIQKMGGTVLTKSAVTQLIEKDGKIAEVEINENDRIATDYVISNIHPTTTFSLVKESSNLRKIFRNRMNNLQNTFGMFTVNIALKKNAVPYLNRNMYIYQTNDVWKISEFQENTNIRGLLITFRVPEDGDKFTRNIDLLTPMFWNEVSPWIGTQVGKRGDDYQLFKKQKAEACIQLASMYLPELKNGIQSFYTSTPLTYFDYTATEQGSAYGIQKDFQQLLYTMLTPRSPIPNLLLTGQNLNLHGILGVSMTSVYTCSEIVGMDPLLNDILNEQIR